jgi:hypothetical protein
MIIINYNLKTDFESDILNAKSVLLKKNVTCVAIHGKEEIESSKSGIKPLLSWIDGSRNLNGASIADRVIGRAAAWLDVLLDPISVYSPVVSVDAVSILMSHNIILYCDKIVPMILNRLNTAPCPLDACLKDINNSMRALSIIRSKIG